MKCVLAITTTGSAREARALANTLVDERLVACVNILPKATSIYRWNGKRCRATECVLLMKTTRTRIAALRRRLPQLHAYDCPELIVIPITAGLPAYLRWVSTSVGG